MRSLDSPVLKPSLIRISAARLIEVGAAPQGDGQQDEAASVQFDAASPEVASSAPGRAVEGADARRARAREQLADAEARLAETQELLERLEREANLACAMVEDARQQAAAIREEAQREGYRVGLEQAEREMAERLSAVTALAEGAVRARAEFLQRCEPEVIGLVLEIARTVIGQQLALDREALADVARRALSIAGEAEQYYLHLHPDDAELVERYLQRDTLGMAIQVVRDDHLSPGDCLVRTPYGRVDASVATQLREVREQLVGAA